MVLVIDIGNTNIVMSGVDETNRDRVCFVTRVETNKENSVSRYAALIKKALEDQVESVTGFFGAILSSSVPAITRIVAVATEQIVERSVLVVGPGIKVDIDLGHPDPSQLGPDLLVGAIGGIYKYGVPLIIFDMGTCTTISVINKEGRFLGGMIAPGVAVSQNGMLARASHLPRAPLRTPPHLICGDTVEAIQSGLLYGHAAMTDGMITRIWEDLGYETKVVLTGGLADRVAPLCKQNVELEQELLIQGLMILYRMNLG